MPHTEFQYLPLDAEKKAIRLCDLHPGASDAPLSCSIQTCSLDDEEIKYEALSYVWGNPDPVCPITVNGQAFKIARNLEVALRHLRHESESRRLWIDAMCINQGENQEKSSQVHRMHHIFQGAERVVAWLGPEENNSDFAFSKLEEIAAQAEGVTLKWNAEARVKVRRLTESPHLQQAVSAIGDRLYWTRGWVVQELTFAKDVVVIVGNKSIPWTTFNTALGAIMDCSSNPMEYVELQHSVGRVWSLANHVSTMREATINGEKKSILEHLFHFRRWRVSVDSDRIAAFINLPSREDTSRVPINYDWPAEKSYAAFALWHIGSTRTFDCISYARCDVNESGRRIRYKNIGTWIPRWNIGQHKTYSLTYGLDTGEPIFHASNDNKIKLDPMSMARDPDFQHHLLAEGYTVDRVKEVGSVLYAEDIGMIKNYTSPALLEWDAMLDRIDLDNNQYSNKPFKATDFSYMTYATGLPDDAEVDDIFKLLQGTSEPLEPNPQLENEDDNEEKVNSLDQSYEAEDKHSVFIDVENVPDFPEIQQLSLGEELPPTTNFKIGMTETFKMPSLDPRKLALVEAFWRTLIADQWLGGSTRELYLPEEEDEKFQRGRADRAIWIQYSNWKNGISKESIPNLFRDPFFKLQFPVAMMGGAFGRRFMITESGYIGLGPIATCAGDQIILVQGSQTPFMVSKAGQWTMTENQNIIDWQFLGDCYVHGIMDGELWEEREKEGQKKELFFMR